MLIQRARDNLAAVAFANLVGGQDELVFDGHSLLIDHEGCVLARAPQFEEALVVATVDPQAALTARLRDTRLRPPAQKMLPEIRHAGRFERPEHPPVERVGGKVAPLLEPEAEVYAALRLAVHDYVEKNGFRHVVIGLSGGIDSTLVALVAADALGPERVTCVVMPSRWSSEGTQSDARELAHNLGVNTFDLPIAPAMEIYEQMLADRFEGREPDITEENLQARIRGNLLMALSNKFGWLVLTTGNKSEVGVGYSTLYGDTAGGFAVIKDVPKTLVWELARWRNQYARTRGETEPIPQNSIDKPPSAELAPGQQDSDSLPSYEELDAVIADYVDRDLGMAQLLELGHDPEVVAKVLRLVDTAEFKRRRSAPGTKISLKAFGRDRRLPITNRWRESLPSVREGAASHS